MPQRGFNAATLLLTSAVRSRKSVLSWGGYTGIETWQVLSDSLSREERWIVKIETLQDNPLEPHCSETEHRTLSSSFYLATPSAEQPCYHNSLKCLFKHVKDYVCGLSVKSVTPCSAADILFLKCCKTSWDLRRSQRCWGSLEPRGMFNAMSTACRLYEIGHLDWLWREDVAECCKTQSRRLAEGN